MLLGGFVQVIYLGHVDRVGWGRRFLSVDPKMKTMSLSEPRGPAAKAFTRRRLIGFLGMISQRGAKTARRPMGRQSPL